VSLRLLLIRHAQAGNAPLDRDRPLTEQGTRDAELISTWLSRAGTVPDLVLVSPARRAVETWERAGAALWPVPAPLVEDRNYRNSVADLLEVVHEAPETVGTLALVGHNPSLAGLAYELDDGEGDAAARQLLGRGFPAGGLAVFELAGTFADAATGTATLTAFRAPGR
jgi:phosphohistidine phosphatase